MFKWVAIAMSFLILLTSLRDVATYANFYLNQDYISQNLCINKAKPELMCFGKCVLTDSLIENHEKEDNNIPMSQQEKPLVFVLPIMVNIHNSLSSLDVKKRSIAFKREMYSFQYQDEIFHPPSILT